MMGKVFSGIGCQNKAWNVKLTFWQCGSQEKDQCSKQNTVVGIAPTIDMAVLVRALELEGDAL